MSEHTLPKTIDPLRYADQNKILEGSLSIKLMPRLAELLVDTNGTVDAVLEFERDAQNYRVLNGKVDATVTLLCQRCLQPVAKPIQSQFALGMVFTDEQAQNLPRAYEPLLVDLDNLEIADIIEEELILSLPMFAYHDECRNEHAPEVESDDFDKGEEKENPFDVLSALKLKD